MRITNQMMAANALGNLNSLRSRMNTLQQQISSGDRISKPSEDPSAGADVMRIQNRMQMLTQWDSNLGDAKVWIGSTENALGDLMDMVGKARDIAVTGSNGALSDEGRKALLPEVDELLKSLTTTLNQEHADGTLFGGFAGSSPPLFTIDPVTGVVTYAGDTSAVQRNVGPGTTMSVNISGDRINDPADVDNMLKVVWDLRESLNTGPATAVGANLDRLDKVFNNLNALRSEIGAKDQRLEQLEAKAKDTSIHLSELLQQVQGVEMEKALTELASADTAYRAALQVTGRILPQTLADFLR